MKSFLPGINILLDNISEPTSGAGEIGGGGSFEDGWTLGSDGKWYLYIDGELVDGPYEEKP